MKPRLTWHQVALVLVLVLLVATSCGVSEPATAVARPDPSLTPAPTTTMAPAPTTEPSATPLSTAEPAPAGPSEELTGAQISTLSSLQQVDDYPLYVMHYQGDYESLVAQWQDRARVDVMEPAASLAGWACSLFAALGDEGAMLYGRNFDWRFSPGLLLFTEPPDGYASVSMVDIEYLGFGAGNAENLADREPEDLQDLLYAPWLPFDGMNETGLAVGMAAVPAGGVRP
ncbi:MAG: hypothetical protein PVI09_20930, partial [Anaerolineae bacterium]